MISSTWGISRVDDVQSYRVTDSLCGFQRSVQPLHLQLPALLLTEVVGNDNCSQPSYGRNGSAVAWHWSQHASSEWTLVVYQDVENVLMSTVAKRVNLKMLVDITFTVCEEHWLFTVSDHCEPGLMYMFSGWDGVPPSRLVMNSETLWTISDIPAVGV